MSTVFHTFAPGELDPSRCARPMPSGTCRRTAGAHRKDVRKRGKRPLRKGDRHKNRPKKADQVFVFWDDEGKDVGRKGHKEHRLIYGAAVDENGTLIHEVESPDGRTQPPTEVWLDALLEVGRRTKQRSMFAYGFRYDLTMLARGLPPKTRYFLPRRDERPLCALPEDSKRRPSPVPLYWGDYQVDLQGTRFSVAKLRRHPDGQPMRSPKGKRMYWRMAVWDVIKFFQCSFVDALDAWRRKTKTSKRKAENLESELVIANKVLDEMRRMKSKRAEFDRMPWGEVKRYCQSECHYGARLVRELVTACKRIGVSLRRFDSAGSISDALMSNNQVGQFMSDKNVSKLLLDSVKKRGFMRAVMCAFAGGRFESVYCGIQRGKVYAKDICSAYPYAMYLHPCLRCGTWRHVRDRRGIDKVIEGAGLALVRVRAFGRDKNQSLGSFHNRDAKRNITFPIDNLTWTWKHEYLAARDAMQDRCEVLEAYVYSTECDHHPFKFMAELYLERLRVGKEGRGTALKLGYNGCAGKTMQHVGSHKWQEYVWAGNTTSRTRSQLLHAIAGFKNQWDVCYVATDSIFALRDVPFPEPEPTGTAGAAAFDKPPLGAWERGKYVYEGMCFVRPGIAFPLSATPEQLKEIKARGISKSVLLENIPAVVELMNSQAGIEDESRKLEFKRRIFSGMKISITKRGKGAMTSYHEAKSYGQWYDQELGIQLSARPKRFCRMPGEVGMLLPWPDKPESLAYDPTKKSEEAEELQRTQDLMYEQPDLDMADFSEDA